MGQIILEYYETTKSIDINFYRSNKYWWMGDIKLNANVILSGDDSRPNGFSIVGLNHFSGTDVKCEIYKLYCKNPSSLMSLIKSTL